MKKINLDKRVTRNIGLLFMLAILVALGPKVANKIKSEKRAHDFFEYMMEELDNYVVEKEDVKSFEKLYEEDPAFADSYLSHLSQTSAEFTRSLAKSSHIINNFDDTITFKQVLETLEAEGYNMMPNLTILAEKEDRIATLKKAKANVEARKKDNIKKNSMKSTNVIKR